MLRRLVRRRRALLQRVLFELMEPRQLLSTCVIDPEMRPSLAPDVQGTAGDDHIVISAGPKPGDLVINCGPGNEMIVHNVLHIFIDGGDGNDHIEFRSGGTNINVQIAGGTGDDILEAAAKSTIFDGGPGNDTIAFHPEHRQQHANIKFDGALHGVVVRFDQGLVLDDGFGDQDQVSGIHNIEGTPFDDTIYAGPDTYGIDGNDGDDHLIVPAGARRSGLSGGAGNDLLDATASSAHFMPGSGNDTVLGGDGRDALSYGSDRFATSGVNLRLDLGWAEDGYGGTDVISNVDHVIVDSKFASTIYGTDRDETLWGGEGADYVFGGGGDDWLSGGHFATLLGGNGNDHIDTDFDFNFIDGGAGADEIVLWGYKICRDEIVKDAADTIVDERIPPRPGPNGKVDLPGHDGHHKAKKHLKKNGAKLKKHPKAKPLSVVHKPVSVTQMLIRRA
jgi:Ca2+-binding RTX toxin-like protein